MQWGEGLDVTMAPYWYIQEWKVEKPHDKWFYRPSASVVSEVKNAVDSTISEEEQSLLLIYQADWQQRLLQRYGKDMVFLDATYRTTKYALSLVFCV